MAEYVVRVNDNDIDIGKMEKTEAHIRGKRHRAFSIFIFNHKKQLLLQKRAESKYHSGGLWTNTCCSHPRPNEKLMVAAHRRLKEEMGFDCALSELFVFRYTAQLDKGLIENEIDHVIFGEYNENPKPNSDEVSAYAWHTLDEIATNINEAPETYTFWFKVAVKEILLYQKRKENNIL